VFIYTVQSARKFSTIHRGLPVVTAFVERYVLKKLLIYGKMVGTPCTRDLGMNTVECADSSSTFRSMDKMDTFCNSCTVA